MFVPAQTISDCPVLCLKTRMRIEKLDNRCHRAHKYIIILLRNDNAWSAPSIYPKYYSTDRFKHLREDYTLKGLCYLISLLTMLLRIRTEY